jgi:septum formation protein
VSVPLVLASSSAARAAMLQRAGLEVERLPASLDEEEIKAAFRQDGADPATCATALAEAKAERVSQRRTGALVIGGDQILVCNGVWFDKPPDRDHARAQLQALRGRTHELVTAVCVTQNGSVVWHHVDQPSLTMRSFSDAFLDDYLARAGDAVLSSVGAYQLEGLGAQLFSRVEGDFFSVLGLPLLPLLDFLRGNGAIPS